MKKSIHILWFLAFFLLFPLLFYKQGFGINVMLYGLALLVFWVSHARQKAWSVSGMIWMAANLLCLASVAIYGSTLALLAGLIVVATTAVYFNQNNVNPFHSIIAALNTLILAPFSLDTNFNITRRRRMNSKQFTLYIILPASIVFTFIMLYSMSDNLFAEVLKSIDIDIFNIRFILTLVMGLLIFYTVVHTQVSRKLARLEKWAGTKAGVKDRFPIKIIPAEYEQATGTITLALLNILILSVILTDVRYRVLGEALPAGVSHSEYLHQGIFSLIVSILGAILMIAWLYRRKGQKSPALKALSVVWLSQNAILVVLNALRNSSYIIDMSLTYKRIGVYFYLLAALLGLILTINYIIKQQNFLHLFRVNAYAFLAIAVLASPVPWDQLITRYNVHHAIDHEQSIDYKYINSLRNPDLDYLYQYRNEVLVQSQAEHLAMNREAEFLKQKQTKFLSRTLYKTHQNKLYREVIEPQN